MTRTAGEPARPGRPRRADAARNAGLLLAAAKALFHERGPDVALDEVARRAGVGNATLYRHFPTREDLLAAAYADEADALCRRGDALLGEPSPGAALFEWLDGFIVHVATMRALALAATEGPGERRSELFGRWHGSMRATAESLLARARDAGEVRVDLDVGDLLALANGVAIAGTSAGHARQLLRLLRQGLEPVPDVQSTA